MKLDLKNCPYLLVSIGRGVRQIISAWWQKQRFLTKPAGPKWAGRKQRWWRTKAEIPPWIKTNASCFVPRVRLKLICLRRPGWSVTTPRNRWFYSFLWRLQVTLSPPPQPPTGTTLNLNHWLWKNKNKQQTETFNESEPSLFVSSRMYLVLQPENWNVLVRTIIRFLAAKQYMEYTYTNTYKRICECIVYLKKKITGRVFKIILSDDDQVNRHTRI